MNRMNELPRYIDRYEIAEIEIKGLERKEKEETMNSYR